MITATPPVQEKKNYLNATHGLKSWLLTQDHKRIAILYLIAVAFFFALGGIFATLIRIELATPAGDLVESNVYNKFFTMHGILMVFFVLIPGIPAILGNFVLPMMVGAKDLAFPLINLLSWYLYMIGGVFTLYVLASGGVDTGWTFYTPFSTSYSNGYVIAAGLGIFINGFSGILTGLNFIVTVHRMWAPGLTWFRLPLFVWAHYATAMIQILGTPVVAVTLFLVVLERGFHIGFFDPAYGGDPVLFQHMFWFYSHPAVYIMILPAMGVVTEIMTTFCSKKPFGYTFIAFSSVAIAVFGFFVWGHHLFVASQSVYAALVFSVLSYIVAIPSAIKVFNWTATMYKGSVRLETPMLYALGFIGLFTVGGLTGLFLAAIGMNVHLTDTYFVVAHFHFVMVGGAIMGLVGGLHYWWPKMFGVMYSQSLSKISAVLIFLGFNATFFPQFLLGYMGMPRRYHVYPPEWQVLNVMSTAGATLLAGGFGLTAIYFIWSLKFGEPAGDNPLGFDDARVADIIAADHRKFRSHARDHTGSVHVLNGGGCSRWLVRLRLPSDTTSKAPSNRKTARPSACGCFLSPKSCSSVACSWRTSSIARRPGCVRVSQQQDQSSDRGVQYDCPDLQQSYDGAGGERRIVGQEEADHPVSHPNAPPGGSVPGCKGIRVSRQVGASRGSRAEFRMRRLRGCRPRIALFFALLRDDWFARNPHAGRVPDPALPHLAGGERRLHCEMVHAGRNVRLVLALRGYRLDFPVPPVVPY